MKIRKDWAKMVAKMQDSPPKPTLFDQEGAYFKQNFRNGCLWAL